MRGVVRGAIRSHQQVADILGITHQAVAQGEQKAFTKLRKLLAEDPIVRRIMEGETFDDLDPGSAIEEVSPRPSGVHQGKGDPRRKQRARAVRDRPARKSRRPRK